MKKLTYRLLSVVLAIGLMLNTICASAAYNFVTLHFEPKDAEMVVEAEDFKGSGFSIVEDREASGGRALVSGKGTVSYTFTLDTAVKNLTIYAYHKSSGITKALTWISLEGFERYALYDYKYNVYNSTRFYYHDASAGSYTINLTGARVGQYIDKFVIKYDKDETKVETTTSSSTATTTQTAEAQIDLSKYRPGDPKLETKDIAEIKEETPGYFVAECEDATFKRQTGTVLNNKDASGNMAYMNTSSSDNKDSETGETELRFKFYVSKSANYRVWLRYFTPDSNHKDAWISFDGIEWKECGNGSKSTAFKWQNFFNVNLREGWHTLEVKHRTTGWIMDKFIVTSDKSFSPKGLGSIEGNDAPAADLSAVQKVAAKRLNPKFKSNNFRMRSDADFEILVGDMMVPSTNIAAALGVAQQTKDDYFLIVRGRQYMKFYDGSDRIISSGKALTASKATYSLPEEDDILMISLNVAQETFGFDYEYDPSENTIHIFDNYTEPYVRTATDEELIVTAEKKSIYYTIPYDNPDAKVEVFMRMQLHDSEGVKSMNWDNLNTLANGGTSYKKMDADGINVWYKAQTPVYIDGAFRGMQFVSEDDPHYVRVVITENGVQNEFMKLSRSGKGWDRKVTAHEYKYNTNGELLLVPTFENIGYYIDHENDNSSCTITYRKVGEKQWNPVFDPTHDTETNQFRGTIAFLEQDTEYEVKAEITAGSSVIKESIATVRTWQDNPPVASTIKLKDIYSGSGDLTLMDLKGTEDGWLKIDGEGMTVDAKKEFFNAVNISNCEYLIFENVKVRGGTDMGIVVDQFCRDIRIVNCDIAEWGTGSVQDPDLGEYYRVGKNLNYRAGIQAISSVNLVVERCYIHDSDSNTNPWTALRYNKIHPAGSTAVMLWGQKGTVIRYNDFIGSDPHRWNDVLEGTNNGTLGHGSTGSDSDIYGNMLAFSNDDSMELDGAQMNVRVYQNRIEQTYVGISIVPNNMGPSYIYRNLIATQSDVVDNDGLSLKAGGFNNHWARTNIFNNIFRVSGGCLRNIDYGGTGAWHGTVRNNIFAAYKDGKYGSGRTIENNFADERDDYDYDLICGSSYTIPEGAEQHGIFDTPQFVNEAEGHFGLVEDTPGWRAGAPVGSFTATDKPHIGVFAGDEYDENFLPARPIDMSADMYTLNLKPGQEGTVKINVGNVEEGHTYSIMKNRDFDFIEILNEDKEAVALEPNSVIELKLKSNTTGKAAVLVRLDNGYSVPIMIYCE